MSGTDNIQIVKNAYEAFGRGDLDSILASLTEDIDWAADTSSDAAPWYGPRRGKDAAAAFFEDIGKTIEIDDFTIGACWSRRQRPWAKAPKSVR